MRKKSVLSAVGGVLLVAVAAWFGIDLDTSTSGDPTSPTSTAAALTGGVSTSRNATAAPKSSASSNLPTCPINSLPEQADEVVDDILAGGPFDYPADDGTHFGNYQRILPREKSSFYREYTVETPGVRHRGARRIVVGGGTETDPEVWYYTDDHYESFCEIPDAEE